MENHDDFAFEPIRGLPDHLPKGERLLWQGAPDWRLLAIQAFHVRKVAIYFALIAAWHEGRVPPLRMDSARGHDLTFALVRALCLIDEHTRQLDQARKAAHNAAATTDLIANGQTSESTDKPGADKPGTDAPAGHHSARPTPSGPGEPARPNGDPADEARTGGAPTSGNPTSGAPTSGDPTSSETADGHNVVDELVGWTNELAVRLANDGDRDGFRLRAFLLDARHRGMPRALEQLHELGEHRSETGLDLTGVATDLAIDAAARRQDWAALGQLYHQRAAWTRDPHLRAALFVMGTLYEYRHGSTDVELLMSGTRCIGALRTLQGEPPELLHAMLHLAILTGIERGVAPMAVRLIHEHTSDPDLQLLAALGTAGRLTSGVGIAGNALTVEAQMALALRLCVAPVPGWLAHLGTDSSLALKPPDADLAHTQALWRGWSLIAGTLEPASPAVRAASGPITLSGASVSLRPSSPMELWGHTLTGGAAHQRDLLEEVLSAQPDGPVAEAARTALVLVFAAQGRWDRARGSLEQLLPTPFTGLLERWLEHAERGEPRTAAAWYDEQSGPGPQPHAFTDDHRDARTPFLTGAHAVVPGPDERRVTPPRVDVRGVDLARAATPAMPDVVALLDHWTQATPAERQMLDQQAAAALERAARAEGVEQAPPAALVEFARRHPEATATALAIARSLAGRGEWAESVRLREEIARRVRDRRQRADVYFELGEAWEQHLGRPDLALEQYMVSFMCEAGSARTLDRLEALYRHYNMHHDLLSAWGAAVSYAERSGDLERATELLQRRSAYLAEEMQRPEDAARALRHALTLQPGSAAVMDALAPLVPRIPDELALHCLWLHARTLDAEARTALLAQRPWSRLAAMLDLSALDVAGSAPPARS